MILIVIWQPTVYLLVQHSHNLSIKININISSDEEPGYLHTYVTRVFHCMDAYVWVFWFLTVGFVRTHDQFCSNYYGAIGHYKRDLCMSNSSQSIYNQCCNTLNGLLNKYMISSIILIVTIDYLCPFFGNQVLNDSWYIILIFSCFCLFIHIYLHIIVKLAIQ